MENNPSEKARTSLRTKVAGVFGLVVLAVVFFAFPLITLARGQENNLKIPGLGNFPFSSPQLQKLLQGCGNNGTNGNNGNDPSDSNNIVCNSSPFDRQAFQKQLQEFFDGIFADIQIDPSNGDPSDASSPFDAKAFQQQLQKFLSEICTDIGNINCGSPNTTTVVRTQS